MRFRLLNKWYALINGYFWTPCPICKKYFGGHEWKSFCYGHSLMIDECKATAVCPDCGKKGLGNV